MSDGFGKPEYDTNQLYNLCMQLANAKGVDTSKLSNNSSSSGINQGSGVGGASPTPQQPLSDEAFTNAFNNLRGNGTNILTAAINKVISDKTGQQNSNANQQQASPIKESGAASTFHKNSSAVAPDYAKDTRFEPDNGAEFDLFGDEDEDEDFSEDFKTPTGFEDETFSDSFASASSDFKTPTGFEDETSNTEESDDFETPTGFEDETSNTSSVPPHIEYVYDSDEGTNDFGTDTSSGWEGVGSACSNSAEDINNVQDENYSFDPSAFTFNGQSYSFNFQAPFLGSVVPPMMQQGTTEQTSMSYKDVINAFTTQLVNNFGGLDRIGSFIVKNDRVIVNQCVFAPQLGDVLKSLPEDVRVEVASGNYRWLVNYAILKDMRYLQFLSFDDIGFVNLKVRRDWGISSAFSHKKFFKQCKSLQCLELGSRVYTQADYDKAENVFAYFDKTDKIMTTLYSSLFKGSSHCWKSVRNAYQDPDRSGISKVFGITAGIVGGTVTGTLGVGAKLAQLGRKGAKGVKDFFGDVKNNLN